MSLQGYQQLQAQSQDDAALLGNFLPKFTSAGIDFQSEQLSISQTLAKIAEFSAQQGWIMYRDELLICTEAPSRTDIIEAEWINANNTLKVKLIGTDLYQVTHITSKEQGDKLFSVQPVILRSNLKGEHNTALYRCWWQQASSGEHKGRWLPLTQQFIGFSNDKEQQ